MKVVFKYCWQFFKKLDKQLLLCVIACSVFSVVLLYSIVENSVILNPRPSLYKTQIIAICIGLFLALFLSLLDYRKLAQLWFIYAPVTIIFVMLTFTGLGIQREGADDKAWINLGFMTVQPSEFLKLAFIMSFAYHLFKVDKKINEPKNVLLLCLHGAVPVMLIVAQGDDGTAFVFALIFAAMMFTAGLSLKYIIPALVAIPFAGAFIWFKVLQPHQKKRFLVLFDETLDPLGIGNQQRQGKIALGSGQLFGKGLFGGDYSYVPEVQNDFIFAHVGQTLGFIGCLALIGVLAFICLKILANSRLAKDKLGQQICVGVFTLIFSHCVLNIGMVLGVLPVIGVPLPFTSGGGTAMMSMYIAIGMVLSVYSHSNKNTNLFYDSN